jgi:hypothetical protein
MNDRLRGTLSAVAVVALFLLHDDYWLADDPRLVLGLPVGLVYHLGYCAVTAAVMAVLAARGRLDRP